jgi:hypothetical protein
MRTAAYKRSKSQETLAKMFAAQPSSIKVEVTDLEKNVSTIYQAIKAAARYLGIDKRYIEHYIYLNQNKPVLDRYTFKFLNSDSLKLVNVEKVQKKSLKIEVTNIKTKEITIYPSIGAAARCLGYRQPSISLYLKENRTNPFKGIYLFRLV